MSFYEAKWLAGLKEDLEWKFTWTDWEYTYQEIDVEYVRDEFGRVHKHPRYNVYNFIVVRQLKRKFNPYGEDPSWEVPIEDQDMYCEKMGFTRNETPHFM